MACICAVKFLIDVSNVMKKVFYVFVLFVLTISLNTSAQINKNACEQRSEMMKLNKKLQELKVSKASKKRAKEDSRDGWKASGALLLEQQYERAAIYMNSFEDDLVTPKFVHGEGLSVGAVYDGAMMQARELARLNLIGSIETDIAQVVENSVSNNQLSSNEAASVVKTLSCSKSIISKKLGQTIPAIERYRKLPNGNYEVYVQTFYSMDKARELSKETLRSELENETEGLGEKVCDIMGW